jgi:hypothetical protein
VLLLVVTKCYLWLTVRVVCKESIVRGLCFFVSCVQIVFRAV